MDSSHTGACKTMQAICTRSTLMRGEKKWLAQIETASGLGYGLDVNIDNDAYWFLKQHRTLVLQAEM